MRLYLFPMLVALYTGKTAQQGSDLRAILVVGLALFILATAACTSADGPDCHEGAEPFVKYELFMGRSNASGEVVDDVAWDAFLEDSVTPRFPDGLTVLDGRGQWRNADGVIEKERSKVLVILAPSGDDTMGPIDEVSEEYERRFGQESVLRVVSDACVSFS